MLRTAFAQVIDAPFQSHAGDEDHRERDDQRLQRRQPRRRGHQQEPRERRADAVGQPERKEVVPPDQVHRQTAADGHGARNESGIEDEVHGAEQGEGEGDAADGAGGVTSQKNSEAALHIARAAAAMLKRTRVAVRDSRASPIDITRPSAPASNAPAAGPNRSAAAIVNVSDSDRLIGNPGMRTVAHPVIRVSSASTSHMRRERRGDKFRRRDASTTPPLAMTAARYAGRTTTSSSAASRN